MGEILSSQRENLTVFPVSLGVGGLVRSMKYNKYYALVGNSGDVAIVLASKVIRALPYREG